MFSPATRVQISTTRHYHRVFAAACNLPNGMRKRHYLGLVGIFKLFKTQLSVTAFTPSHQLSTFGKAQNKVPTAVNLNSAEAFAAVTWI